MPPTFTDEGIRAARELAPAHPRLAVLVLSQYVEVTYALKLIREGGERSATCSRTASSTSPRWPTRCAGSLAGECVIEPTLVEQLVDAQLIDDPLAELTAREREVLALMAEGHTDRGIREALFLSQKTVESHMRSIFRKLATPRQPERQPPRPRRARLPAPSRAQRRGLNSGI